MFRAILGGMIEFSHLYRRLKAFTCFGLRYRVQSGGLREIDVKRAIVHHLGTLDNFRDVKSRLDVLRLGILRLAQLSVDVDILPHLLVGK